MTNSIYLLYLYVILSRAREGNKIPEDTSHSSTTGVTLPNPASPIAMHLVHYLKIVLTGLCGVLDVLKFKT